MIVLSIEGGHILDVRRVDGDENILAIFDYDVRGSGVMNIDGEEGYVLIEYITPAKLSSDEQAAVGAALGQDSPEADTE